MAEAVTKHAKLRVWRGVRREAGHHEMFDVPYEEGMSVLDALRWVRAHVDSTLAIRYSCINANACKTCMALVNGHVEYTCLAKLVPGTMTIEPLPKRPLVRDLVTDLLTDEEKV